MDIVNAISEDFTKSYDEYLMKCFSLLGISLNDIKDRECFRTIQPVMDSEEIHRYYIDGLNILALKITTTLDIESGYIYRMEIEPIPTV